jgi:recyclin-1
MCDTTENGWEVSDHGGDWEMDKVWTNKRELFYEQWKWDPLRNITKGGTLDFGTLNGFMAYIFASTREHRLMFPPALQVLLRFGERLANDVVSLSTL